MWLTPICKLTIDQIYLSRKEASRDIAINGHFLVRVPLAENPSLALFYVERARAQVPVEELTAPDVKVQTLLSK